MEDKDFQNKISVAICFGFKSKIAQEFEVAESTVERWTRGVARPMPNLKKKILEFIDFLVVNNIPY